jgi:tetratricopeptide (TPR) repeat protein
MKLIPKNSIINYIALFVLSCIVFCCNAFAQKQLNIANADSVKQKAISIQFSNPDSAIILYKDLCKYYQNNKNLDAYYTAQIRLASCYAMQQKNNETLKIYEDCKKYFTQKNDSLNLHNVYSGIAGVCYNLNDSKKAIQYLEMAEKMCNANKHPNLKFISLLNLENCFVMTNQYDSALKCCLQAGKLLNLTNNLSFEYGLKSRLSLLYYLKHQYGLAIENALTALRLSKNSDKRVAMDAYKVLGLCYLDRKKFIESNLYLDSAVLMSKVINSQKDYFEILQSKFQIDTLTHNYERGCENLLKIIDAKDSLYETNKNNLTRELLVKYEAEKRESEKKLLETQKKLLQIENARRSDVIVQQRVLITVIILLSSAVIGLLFFYQKYRSKQQKKMLEKEKIAAELKSLKSQLNPHFIQNIFQLISNQVVINPSQVSTFLQKTANYFRSVLYSSDITVQSLEDEILFTEKYVEFQQLLFQDKLTYHIDIADDVDCYEIMVPAMLLQPFIENSVKYGLQLSQQPMHININILISGNYLNIVIIDNGHFIHNENNVNDKSFGIDLIAKRLELFYQNTNQKPILTTTADDNNNGFKVSLSLPLK